MKSLSRTAALTAAAIAACAGSSLAFQPNGPASDPAPVVGKLPIIAFTVKGRAAYRPEPGMKWQVLKQGDMLAEGGQIQVSPNSMAQIQIGRGQILTIDRNTIVTLRVASNVDGVETSRVDMPAGRIAFDVTSTAVKNDLQVKAPDATLAVTGTGGTMEANAGFDTFSQNDHGTFKVLFDNLALASLVEGDSTQKGKPDPAALGLSNLYQEINDVRAYDGDEQLFVQDHIAFGNNLGSTFDLPTEFNQLVGPTYLKFSETGRQLSQVDLFDSEGGQRNSLNGFVDTAVAGTPYFDADAGRVVFLGLENIPNEEETNTPIIRVLNPGVSGRNFSVFNEFPPTGVFARVSWEFRGVGALGTEVFVSGRDSQTDVPGQIFQVSRQPNSFPQEKMVLNLDLQNGLATDNQSGTAFVIGSLPGNEFGFAGQSQAVLLQIDPRNNYIVSGYSTDNGDFSPSPSSRGGAVGQLANVSQVTGLAYAGDTLVLTAKTKDGRNLVIQYNPAATNGAGDPLIRRVTQSESAAFAANSFKNIVPPSPTNLSDASRSVDREFINSTFADLAYSSSAAKSGIVSSLARAQVLSVARDPLACIDTGALALLQQIVPQFAEQRSGMGQTITQFRETVAQADPNHPCLPCNSISNELRKQQTGRRRR